MGNQQMMGGLLGGLAQGAKFGLELEERRETQQHRKDLLRLSRDKLSADIKSDELKGEMDREQRELMKPLIRQFLAGQGLPLQGAAPGAEAETIGGGMSLTGVGYQPQAQTQMTGGEMIAFPDKTSPTTPWAWRTMPESQPYAASIDSASRQTGVPADLIAAVGRHESNWDPKAVSKAGARGLFQFMPATARQYGVDVDDPDSSISGAARYLRDLGAKYKGPGGETNWALAVAAYNAGPGRVDQYGGQIPPFKETRDFVGRVVQSVQGARAAHNDPQTMQSMEPTPPAIGPGAPKPNVSLQVNPMTGNMSFTMGPGQWDISYQDRRLPDGSIQQMQIKTDKQTGRTIQEPMGPPAAPEAVLDSERNAVALGYPVGSPAAKNAGAHLRMLPNLQPDQRGIAFERIQNQGREFSARRGAGGGQAGGGQPRTSLAEEARSQKAADVAAETRARVQTTTEESPLSGPPLKEWNALAGVHQKLEGVGQRYKPNYVGTPVHQAWLATNKDFQTAWQAAGKGQYKSGMFTGVMGGMLDRFKGSVDPEQEAFYRGLGDLQDTILRERSGAATSPGEFARVTEFAIDKWDSPRAFEAGFRRLQDDVHGRMRELKSSVTTPATQLKTPERPAVTGARLVDEFGRGDLSRNEATKGLRAIGLTDAQITEALGGK